MILRRLLPRRFLTWITLLFTALAFAVYVGSGRWTFRHISPVGSNLISRVLWIHGGGIEIGDWSWLLADRPFFQMNDDWVKQDWNWRFTWRGIQHFGYKATFVPLWPAVVGMILLTAWLWWRDPTWVRRGRCRRCGYDLRAAISATCPECGEMTG